AELVRFGAALGARPETLMGLSGLGDLVLTCGSAQSRNFALGQALVEIAREHRIEMPIAEAVNAILAGEMSVDGAISALLTRPLRAEAE
ncbi:MAG TPA: NAD(P)H-dependent glycerol-3-phosphate dehydrogenase, partial [Methylocystis sp.]|nr:NAD(P)H-dependent glycerol-3-phosphate dehydrogenase [Methylocystis sp.]